MASCCSKTNFDGAAGAEWLDVLNKPDYLVKVLKSKPEGVRKASSLYGQILRAGGTDPDKQRPNVQKARASPPTQDTAGYEINVYDPPLRPPLRAPPCD